MCLGTFSRLRRSLATSTLSAAVRILAERFLLYREAISCKVKKPHPKRDEVNSRYHPDSHLTTGTHVRVTYEYGISYYRIIIYRNIQTCS